MEPESESALTTLAFLYTDTSQFHAASELLQKVTRRNPDPKLLAALGAAYEQAREHENAIQAYRKALEPDTDNPQYLSALGRNLIYNEQYEEALVPYQAVVAAQPRNGNAFLRMGQIYRRLRKYGPALENLKKAEALMPESMEVPYNLALLQEAQGQKEEAIQAIQKLLDQTTKADASQHSPREKVNRAIFLERLGVLYRSRENYAAAEETFRQMLESDQENAVRGATQLVETPAPGQRAIPGAGRGRSGAPAFPRGTQPEADSRFASGRKRTGGTRLPDAAGHAPGQAGGPRGAAHPGSGERARENAIQRPSRLLPRRRSSPRAKKKRNSSTSSGVPSWNGKTNTTLPKSSFIRRWPSTPPVQ